MFVGISLIEQFMGFETIAEETPSMPIKGHYSNWKKRLFVAAVPVPCNPIDPTPKDYRHMGMLALHFT